MCLVRPERAYAQGPRGQAAIAAVQKIKEIQQDNPRFASDGNMMFFMGTVGEGDLTVPGGRCAEGSSIVKSVAIAGDRATITFKPVTWKEKSYRCVDTSRVNRIDFSSGRVFYVQSCTFLGWSKMSKTTPPLSTSAAYARHIAPGELLVFGRRETTNTGLPYLSFRDAEQTQLASVYGLKR